MGNLLIMKSRLLMVLNRSSLLMSFFSSWTAWRTFKKLHPDWRQIVFYSETRQDWHHFSDLISTLNTEKQRRTIYVSSDPLDPGLQYQHSLHKSYCIEEGLFRTIFFQVLKADLLVLTVMDLGNLDLKRSLHPVHYVYLFHSPGSTHMVDFANSYDNYDSLLCVGPHHKAEIRARELQAGLEPKHLIEHGYQRLETLITKAAERNQIYQAGMQPVVVIAPTWGEDSIFNRLGQPLIQVLLDAGIKVIMRPHYHTVRQHPQLIQKLRDHFSTNPDFEFIELMGESDSLFKSHLLICDWSAMAIEYALGLEKPVLFIDLPKRVRNPDWQDLNIEPIEISIREQLGQVLSVNDIGDAATKVSELLTQPEHFREHIRDLREKLIYNLGDSIAVAVREIIRLAAEHKHTGSGA